MFDSYEDYLNYLKSGADEKKSEFDKKLINSKYIILGYKLPFLRKLSKSIIKNGKSKLILSNKKFTYYEELLIYSFVLAYIKIDEKERINEIKTLLSQIDNWSNCDSFCSSLKVVSKNKEIYFDFIKEIISTNKTYFVRVGIVLLMNYYLNEENLEEYFDIVGNINLNEYYIEMAKAWYFATSLAKNFDKTLCYLKNNKSKFTNSELKKIVSKSRDSFRITDENKKLIKGVLIDDDI